MPYMGDQTKKRKLSEAQLKALKQRQSYGFPISVLRDMTPAEIEKLRHEVENAAFELTQEEHRLPGWAAVTIFVAVVLGGLLLAYTMGWLT